VSEDVNHKKRKIDDVSLSTENQPVKKRRNVVLDTSEEVKVKKRELSEEDSMVEISASMLEESKTISKRILDESMSRR
jgi:hypothetical protein